MSTGTVVHIDPIEDNLKRKLRNNFRQLGFGKGEDGSLVLPGTGKESIRNLHATQRLDRMAASRAFLDRDSNRLLHFFANGAEIDPRKIDLSLILVKPDSIHARIFRMASLTWSVPVSNGFGRRLRYLVWDNYHDKLVGIFALGDPVFNLKVRDQLIGWNAADRSNRLVNLLDAYVLGAVPPYNMLLGGKAVACLIRSREVYENFSDAYGNTVGIISGCKKQANLLAVTTSSSMGRSSIYNRLKIGSQSYFERIGYTTGWGHFHIDDALFNEMRNFLRIRAHSYADEHQFGSGPNWRFRTVRAAIDLLDMNSAVLKHGIKREVFLSIFAKNSIKLLSTGEGIPDLSNLQSVKFISNAVRERWILPRSVRRPDFVNWKRQGIIEMFTTAGRCGVETHQMTRDLFA